MSNRFASDTFSFGAGKYRLIVPSLNQGSPRPRPATSGQWIHIPYGGNKFETDGSRLHIVWQPTGGIVIPSAADYAIFDGLYDKFALLITPWGTFNARLDQLDIAPYGDGSFRGACQWSWT